MQLETTRRVTVTMRLIRSIRFLVIVALVSGCGRTAFAQGNEMKPGEGSTAARTGLTGAGEGSSIESAATAGGVDGLGNPTLGGKRRPLYRLQASDVVDISFTVAPEFNQTLTVQPDGYVMLKDVGLVDAQGLNLEEFSHAVQRAYQGYLHDPEVAVTLKDFERPHFIVGGEVGKPGKYELRSDTTVMEAVQIAGGFTEQSKHSQVVLFRRLNDNLMEVHLLNLKKMMKERNMREDTHLRAGDMVFVPKNEISKIARFLSKPAVSMYMNSAQF